MELNRQLADTIGAQVEMLLGMGRSEADNSEIDAAVEAARRGIAAGQPGGGGSTQGQASTSGRPDGLEGASATNAQRTTPSNASEGEIDWEATKGSNGLYLSKYKTKAEAVRGVANSVAMAKVAFTQAETTAQENARLKAEVDRLSRQPVVTPTAALREQPATSPSLRDVEVDSKLDSVLSKLAQGESLTGEDLVDFKRAISEHAFKVAREAAREERESSNAAVRKEADRWAKVESFMAEKYPDSVNFGDELALFIKTNPLVGAGVKALTEQDRHEEAIAGAWEQFAHMQSISPTAKTPSAEDVAKETRLDAADQARREALDIARRDAGIIGAGAGAKGVHENAIAGPSQDEYDRATARMRQGDGAPWRGLVFRDILNHPIFGD